MNQVDVDKIKQRLEQLRNNGSKFPRKSFGPNYKWKPEQKDGASYTIRLLPYPNPSDPFIELWFHYELGEQRKDTVLCPKANKGRSCAVCDFAWSLKETGQDADKVISKNLMAKPRYFAAMIDRADKTQTAKYWGFGKEVYDTLLSKLLDPKLRHYLDTSKGVDIQVNVKKVPNKKFMNTSVEFDRTDSRLAESDTRIQEILNSIKPVEEVFPLLSTADVKLKLTQWVDAGQSKQDVSEEATGSQEVAKGNKTSALDELESTNMDSIDDQFETALNKNAV